MKTRFWLPVFGTLLLCACESHPAVENGTYVLDEEVTLARNAEKHVDEAIREITVRDDSILVAIVDENLTDVKLGLTAGAGGNGSRAVEVENHLAGAGVEIAVIEVPEDAR